VGLAGVVTHTWASASQDLLGAGNGGVVPLHGHLFGQIFGLLPIEHGVVFQEGDEAGFYGAVCLRLFLDQSVHEYNGASMLTGPDTAAKLLALAEGDPVGAFECILKYQGIDSLILLVGLVAGRAIAGPGAPPRNHAFLELV